MKQYLGNILALVGLFAFLLFLQMVGDRKEPPQTLPEATPMTEKVEEMAVVELKQKEEKAPQKQPERKREPQQMGKKESPPELDTAAARELYRLHNQNSEPLAVKEYIPFENPLAYQQ